jgi:hypothetical protein
MQVVYVDISAQSLYILTVVVAAVLVAGFASLWYRIGRMRDCVIGEIQGMESSVVRAIEQAAVFDLDAEKRLDDDEEHLSVVDNEIAALENTKLLPEVI